MTCDKCKECYKMGDKYCRWCGSSLGKYEAEKAIAVIGCIITAILTLVLFIELIALFAGIQPVWTNLADYSYTLFLIVPTFVNLFTVDGPAIYVLYVLLIIAVLVSIFLLVKKSVKPLEEKNIEKFTETSFFKVMTLFAALYFVEFVFALILTLCNIEIGDLPERANWEYMFDLLFASVWEELITRVLYLGVPLLIVAIILKKQQLWKYLLGGCGLNKVALIFIVFSAVMFGAGHLNNWESWKFFTTFLFGLIAGYLFCKFGLYATISMHFLTDYMQAEMWLTNSDTIVFTAIILFIVMLMGIPYVYVYVRDGIKYLKTEFKSKDFF